MMLKSFLFATAVLIAAPAMAQDTMTQPAPAPAPAPAPDATTPAPDATGTDKVAQVVDAEFATYDKDATGDLNKTEFESWMVALRTASEPGLKADAPEVQTWLGQAFAQADADKSTTVSKTELTGFLTPKAS